MLEHGGNVRAAAKQYGIPAADWLDLSTGINPNAWPAPAPPPEAWARLPEDEDGLETAAHSYYGASTLLPVAGSQAAIQALPLLRAPCRVRVLHPGYAEHAHAWQRAGHQVTPTAPAALDQAIASTDVLVLIHPNNPTGASFAREQLLDWRAQLAAHGGWLVVDEAFMDATPEQSLISCGTLAGLIVLRSLGKFFGLAGARVGFAFAETEWLDGLRAQLGPWVVAAPSRWIATQALADRAWQAAARQRLRQDSERLARLLERYGLTPRGGCALFQWVPTPEARRIHERLARAGILTRFIPDPPGLRFGLPGTETDWMRLDVALAKLRLDPLSHRERAKVRGS